MCLHLVPCTLARLCCPAKQQGMEQDHTALKDHSTGQKICIWVLIYIQVCNAIMNVPVAVIRPQSMYCPAPFWQQLALLLQSSPGTPELSLENKATFYDGAAGILHCGRVFAGVLESLSSTGR